MVGEVYGTKKKTGLKEKDPLAVASATPIKPSTPVNRSIEYSEDAPSFIIKVIKPGDRSNCSVGSKTSDISPSVMAQRKQAKEDEAKIAQRRKETEEQRQYERSKPLLE